MEEYFKKGVAARKYYYRLYGAKANYLLQRWYGRRGDEEKFAEDEASQLDGEDGDAMYAIIAEYVGLAEETEFFNITKFSWDRLKRGIKTIMNNATDSWLKKRQLNELIYFACITNDARTFSEAMAEIKDNDSWDDAFWSQQSQGVTLSKFRELAAEIEAKNAKAGP
jgi:hypothetical protein